MPSSHSLQQGLRRAGCETAIAPNPRRAATLSRRKTALGTTWLGTRLGHARSAADALSRRCTQPHTRTATRALGPHALRPQAITKQRVGGRDGDDGRGHAHESACRPCRRGQVGAAMIVAAMVARIGDGRLSAMVGAQQVGAAGRLGLPYGRAKGTCERTWQWAARAAGQGRAGHEQNQRKIREQSSSPAAPRRCARSRISRPCLSGCRTGWVAGVPHQVVGIELDLRTHIGFCGVVGGCKRRVRAREGLQARARGGGGGGGGAGSRT